MCSDICILQDWKRTTPWRKNTHFHRQTGDWNCIYGLWEQRYHTVYSTVLFSVCIEIKLFLLHLCAVLCLTMKKVGLHWDILQKEKWLILQSHCHSYGVFHFDDCVFNFALNAKCLVVCSKCLVVCTQWLYVCVIWKCGCVYQMKTQVPFCEQLRDLMAKSHLAKGVSGLSFCVWGFQLCVCSFEKAIIVLKNVC